MSRLSFISLLLSAAAFAQEDAGAPVDEPDAGVDGGLPMADGGCDSPLACDSGVCTNARCVAATLSANS